MEKINYDHPRFKEIESEVKKRFDQDFNQIQVEVVKTYCEHGEDTGFCGFYEAVLAPSGEIQAAEYLQNHDTEELEQEYKEDTGAETIEQAELIEWLIENKDNEISDAFQESEHYPMWSTLFEAKDSFMSDWLTGHVDELYDAGIGVIDAIGSLNAMMFIAGAGYDFYGAHWIPLYVHLLQWVEVDQDEKSTD